MKFLNKPFPYLDKVRYRILLILIMLVYIVFFMVAFRPFEFENWLTKGWIGLAAMGVYGIIPLIVSQLLIRPVVKIKTFRVKHLILWFFMELFLLTLLMSIIYEDPDYNFIGDFVTTLKYTGIVIIFPYSFALLIIILMQEIKNKPGLSEIDNLKKEVNLISFKDERGKVKVSILESEILYIESTDNYITIYFFAGDKVNKQIVRTSLKNLEKESLSPLLLRCHRSFMVNINNVIWMKKEGRKYLLKIKNIDTFIPVSRNFIPQFRFLLR